MCLLDLLATFRRDRPAWSLKVLLGDDGPLREAVAGLGVAATSCRCPPGCRPGGRRALARRDGGGRLALATRGPGAAWRRRRTWRRFEGGSGPSARPGPDQRDEGARPRRLGRAAGVPVVWHMHDYLGSRTVMARLCGVRRAGGPRGGRLDSVADDAGLSSARGSLSRRSTTPPTSTGSRPAPATAPRSTPRRACPPPRGRSASAWSRRSRGGRGTRSFSTPSRDFRPTCRRGSMLSVGRSTARPARNTRPTS